MSIKVMIPQPLQKLTHGSDSVDVDGSNISELIANIDAKFPGIKDRICDETGKIRRFINIYVNEEDIRFLEGDKTCVNDGDEISIIPAIAGGSK